MLTELAVMPGAAADTVVVAVTGEGGSTEAPLALNCVNVTVIVPATVPTWRPTVALLEFWEIVKVDVQGLGGGLPAVALVQAEPNWAPE